MEEKNKKILSASAICIAILFVLITAIELCVMNFSPINRLLGKYSEQTLYLMSADGVNVGYNSDGSITVGTGYSTLEFSFIDARVGSVGFDIEFPEEFESGKVYIAFADETTSMYRYNRTKLELENESDENIMTCNFSGDVSKLLIEFSVNSNEPVTLKGITLNQSIGAAHIFSVITANLAIAIALFLLIFLLAGNRITRGKYKENRLFCVRAAAVITAVIMMFAMYLTFVHVQKNTVGTYSSFTSTQGDQITQEIVDAFEHGQVSLLDEPSEELLELQNPYENPIRWSKEIDFKWDHCLYNGKYYSYYGIGPVLALFLPYHLITGYYFPNAWATLLFSLVGIIFLTKIYLAVIDKKFKELPINTVLMGLITLQMSSGIFFSAARTYFYELAISAGFMCVAIGAYLLISSNIVWEGKISYTRLGFASFFLGYAVLCRPTLGIYCVAALIFMVLGLKKALDGVEKKKKVGTFFKFAVVALAPLGVLAIVQMTYNYLRFDNPLDFGIQYSLTINDFTHSEFHWKYVLINMYAYLFNMPHFTPSEFPFLASSVERFDLNGYMFIDDAQKNLISVGIIWRALPMFSYLFVGKALKHVEKKKRLISSVLIGVTCMLMPLIIIFVSWESGYAVRYNADFSWMMVIGALVIAFTLYNNVKAKSTRKLINLIFLVSTVLCIYVNAAQVLSFIGILQLY